MSRFRSERAPDAVPETTHADRRVWEIGSIDTPINLGFAVTRNYSPRTKRHLHMWFRVGDHGFAWERPRYNR